MIEDKENKPTYVFGDFILNIGEKCLFHGDKRIDLTPRNFELLLILVENKGKLLEKERLMSAVWKETIVEEGNLTRTISNLRKILGDTKDDVQYIQTVPRVGYRFIAEAYLVEPNEGYADQPANKKSSLTNIFNSLTNIFKWKIVTSIGLVLLLILSILLFVNWNSKRNITNRNSAVKMGVQKIRLTKSPQDEQIMGWTKDGKLRFVKRINNKIVESYVMNQDGSDQSKESSNPIVQNGVWSPNGEMVVFSKVGEAPDELNFLSNADGTNETKLPVKAENVAWSNDGENLVFQAVSNRSKNFEVFLYNINSGKLSELTNSEGFDGDASFSPDGNEIVFVSTRSGDYEIYLMDLKGTNLRRLTNNAAHDSFPKFTPDGTGITFTSNLNGETTDLYFINLTGENLVRLTDWNSNELSRASCSPDGTKIAFNSDKDGNDEIYIMDFEPIKAELLLEDNDAKLQTPSFSKDGKKIIYSAELSDKTGELRVFDLSRKKSEKVLETSSGTNYPRFSPDGKKIAFHQEVKGRWDVFTVNTDGSGLTNLTKHNASDSIPNWLPDNKGLIFRTNRKGESLLSEIFSMNSDGTDQKPLFIKQGSLGWSSISEDGQKIIYSCDRENIAGALLDIYIANADGSDERLLLTHPDNDMQAVFSPDGKKIAFVATSDGNPEIYIMNDDGSNLFRLTRNTSKDLNPVFSRDGKKIIFSSDRDGNSALYQITLSK